MRVGPDRTASSQQLLDTAISAELIHPHTTVACFVSMGSEVQTSTLLEHMIRNDVKVLVPRLGHGLEMGWSFYAGEASLHAMGKHRPAEPDDAVLTADAIDMASMIFIAALAIDHEGNRLGRGAGWYDQALQLRNPDSPIIAICWPEELLDRPIPHSTMDVPVNGVLTPTSFTPIGKRADARPQKVQ